MELQLLIGGVKSNPKHLLRGTNEHILQINGFTMKNELDSKLLLRVFDKIRQHGTKKEDQYLLNGITAYTDLDGYTLFVEDSNVKLQFGFHNQYHFDYDSESQFETFEKRIKQIDKEY
jgi:hypothetical protein